MRRTAVSEKDEQRAIVRLLKIAGFTVYSTSQVRPSMVSEGIPDLMVFKGPIFAWIECKARNANGSLRPLRPEQEAFRRVALTAEHEHIVGGLREVQDWLVIFRLGRYTPNGGFMLTPASDAEAARKLAKS